MAKTFRYEEIPLTALSATDLQKEVTDGMLAYTIKIDGHAEAAQALYDPHSGRMGIAWGANATWADIEDVESGIEMYVNDGEAWAARN